MLVPFLLNVQSGIICSWVKKGKCRVQISTQKIAANMYWAPTQCQVQDWALTLMICSIYALSLILPRSLQPAMNLRSQKSNCWIHQSLLLVLRDSKFELQPFREVRHYTFIPVLSILHNTESFLKSLQLSKNTARFSVKQMFFAESTAWEALGVIE